MPTDTENVRSSGKTGSSRRRVKSTRMTQGGHGVTTDKIVSAARPHKSTIRLVEQRAGIITPFKGAHALRHTAATEMLRHGVALEKIGLVQRHRGIDTTAYYAKADVALLKQIAQPWPEVL